MGRSLGLEEVAAEVEADEEGVSARDGDGEWRPRRRESGVAGAGEWRMGGGDPGGEDGGGGAVMRVIDGDEGECRGTVGRKQNGVGLDSRFRFPTPKEQKGHAA